MQKRDSLTWVTGADRPLRSISSPKSQNNDIVADTCYYFSDTAGLGARVYVLDDGVNGAAENVSIDTFRLYLSKLKANDRPVLVYRSWSTA